MRPTAPQLGWLAGVAARSSALVLEGPAGIGKTYLWRELVDQAGTDGARVLRAQPGEAEQRLVGSALIDLCDPVRDDEIAGLPAPQAAALAAALLRQTGETAHPQAVALAFTTLVRQLSAQGTLLIGIDDVQWLDAQTADVLAFTARRLPSAGVGLLLTVRVDAGTSPPGLVADLGDVLDVTRERVPAMTSTELEQLLHERLGAAAAPGVRRMAVRSAAGNPLYGLEVARAMIARGAENALDTVPVPDSLADLVSRHVHALPEATRLGLAAAAAMRRAPLHRLRELGLADSLDPAERAGLLRIDGRTATFTHPLYAAAAYDALGPRERMRLHARLAAVVPGEEERARHLALASDEPDERVAAALDLARERALQRGAPQAALDASVLAVRATPSSGPRLCERRIHLGQLLFRAGDTERARDELTSAATAATDDHQRARALHALARVVNDTEGPVPARTVELAALALAAGDDDLTADIHMGLAVSSADDWRAGFEHARAARELLARSPRPDPLRVAAAISAEVGARLYTGGGADLDACRQAIELQGDDLSLPVSDRALSVLWYLEMWTDDYPAARTHLDHAYRLARDEGDEPSRCYILACRSALELRAGRWAEAERFMDECLAASQASHNPHYARMVGTQRGWLLAYRGDLATARQVADDQLDEALAQGNELSEMHARALRGWCALEDGDATAAAADFDRYRDLLDASHTDEPAIAVFGGDHVEALIAAGRLADAERALNRMVEPAARLGRTSVLAAAARVEALLRAETGEQDASLTAAERAVALYASIERRFEYGRALLAKGQVHRRFKQKALARRELTAARDVFLELGAGAHAERAAAELARVGLRPPAAQELTETERRVAELAARGMTSAEIGQQLFLSTKTVSANLTRVYRKLNVRNRSELIAHLAGTSSDSSVARPS